MARKCCVVNMTAEQEYDDFFFQTKQEIIEFFEEFKSETKTGWRCYKTQSNLGKRLVGLALIGKI